LKRLCTAARMVERAHCDNSTVEDCGVPPEYTYRKCPRKN
jgi:hypothetical protein